MCLREHGNWRLIAASKDRMWPSVVRRVSLHYHGPFFMEEKIGASGGEGLLMSVISNPYFNHLIK